MQRRLGDVGLLRDRGEAGPAGLQQSRLLDRGGGVGDGVGDPAARGLGGRAGVGGVFGGEGPFHLGEQRQQEKRDAAHPVVGGVDQ